MDNEGGNIHKAQWWHARALAQAAPFAIMFNGARLYTVHHAGPNLAANESAYATSTGDLWLMRHFYDYSAITDDPRTYRMEDRWHQAALWLFLFAWVNIVSATFGNMEAHYNKMAMERKMDEEAKWMEIMEAINPSEDAPEEENAEEFQNDNFF